MSASVTGGFIARLRACLWGGCAAMAFFGSGILSAQVPVGPLGLSSQAFLFPDPTLFPGVYPPGINASSKAGEPLSSTVNSPGGSNGRAPTPALQQSFGPNTVYPAVPPTAGQFRSAVVVGAVPRVGLNPLGQGWTVNTNLPFYQQVGFLQWPHQEDVHGNVVAILRAAQAGAPYQLKASSFPFGAVIPPPGNDENGVLLTNGANLTYWMSAPYNPSAKPDNSYYYSPNAKAVFATQPGQALIVWQKALPSITPPARLPADVGYIQQGGGYYLLYTNICFVSGDAVKTPQTMYWTEGAYANTGHAVPVPEAGVQQVNVVYSSAFPQFVTPGDTHGLIAITNTLWFDYALNEIRADNAQGRVFVELLGEQLTGNTRRFLGFEIVDVSAAPQPVEVQVDLGNRIGAYQDGSDDSALTVSPLTGTSRFYYQQNLSGGQINLYATRPTVNLNDFQAYWLTTGVGGLQWPYLFNRYHQDWPANLAAYVNYVRPAAANQAEAALTAVQLPGAENPLIAYQDFENLNPTPAQLGADGVFYTYLTPTLPAHRTLLQFAVGSSVSFERVFSWLDTGLKNNALLSGSVAVNLGAWNPTNHTLASANLAVSPYVITNTVNVGDRIAAPAVELAAGGTNYLAGSIIQEYGNGFNPEAYLDPLVSGFPAANQSAIIPVNAVPGNNTLEVMWFRSDNANTSLGFKPTYWPSLIGHYIVGWPATPAQEIIMADNQGTGPLNEYPGAAIYAQNDPTQPGYNPNEEHAIMFAGTAYALRDDLNNTNVLGYTSAPYVLISYTASDGRPAMLPFHVRREAPEQGILFDYIVNAGSLLQAPYPLPLMAPPVTVAGVSANTAPAASSGDLPANYSPNLPLSYYAGFTFQDRKYNTYVYRGLHAGLPPLQLGVYSAASNNFNPSLPAATAVLNQPFAYYVPVSRQTASLTVSALPLPAGLKASFTANSLVIEGTPTVTGTYTVTNSVLDGADGATNTIQLSLTVLTSGTVVALGPLAVTSTNRYSGATVTYSNRPPFLAQAPATNNSFTMQFYYKNLPSFDWPGYASPPTNGAIVPFLLPVQAGGGFAGDPTSSSTPSLNIVYRPVWPSSLPTLYVGQTQTTPTLSAPGFPAVRGQTGVQVLYQQSIATNDITQPGLYQSVTLFDPTVAKQTSLAAYGLTNIAGGVLGALPTSLPSTYFQGLYFFQTLPPNLVNRLWVDPSTTNLVFEGQFEPQTVGDNYLFVNVLNGADLAAVIGLCSATDPNYVNWVAAVTALSVPLLTFGPAVDTNNVPLAGSYGLQPNATRNFPYNAPVVITSADQQVDSYALSATGPGLGYISFIVGNDGRPADAGQSVTVYVARVGEYGIGALAGLYPGSLVTVADPNPLSESISFQHTLDLGGNTANYEYDWRIAPPAANGGPPASNPTNWTVLTNGIDLAHYTLGGSAGIQSLGDNYAAVRYREIDAAALPANTNWSAWTKSAFAPGYIKRVLTGINPFDQTTTDLFNNPVNTSGSILSQAGSSWQGDVALNASSLTNAGLIQIYETVLNRGKALSINAGYNYGPANSALLLAAGFLSDLYTTVASDAAADEANPTISIGTDNATYGSMATALFAFQGQEPSLLEEDLALLRGRDDSVTTVELSPVFNRLYWNYTSGVGAGQAIYALNYDITDQNSDGVVNAADAAILYPMGHGDAYGHYLTALGNFWGLLMNPNFDWVPTAETVNILGANVAVNYQNERKFASAAGGLAQAGLQVFDLTWRDGYTPGTAGGWSYFDEAYTNPVPRTYLVGTTTVPVVRYWGLDHWAARTVQGAYLNWVVGNAILPPVDPNPSDQGIQKVDRTTVPELNQLPQIANQLQTDLNNAEAGFTPFDLSQNAIPFDINPLEVTGTEPKTHFEQIYERALVALNNAVAAFNDAEGVTEALRSAQDSLTDFQAGVASQELAYNNQLIELYGTPYAEDMGPGGAYPQGYNGPDLLHYTYVNTPNSNLFNGILADPTQTQTFDLDVQQLPQNWTTTMYTNFNFIMQSTAPGYAESTNVVPITIGPDGFFDKPIGWTSQRGTPGQIQQAISKLLAAQDALRQALANAMGDKQSLDKAIVAFNALAVTNATQANNNNNDIADLQTSVANVTGLGEVAQGLLDVAATVAEQTAEDTSKAVPDTFIAGLAAGGSVGAPAAAAVETAGDVVGWAILGAQNVANAAVQAKLAVLQGQIDADTRTINNLGLDAEIKNAVLSLEQQELALQNDPITINQDMRTLSDAQAAYQALVAKGLRLQSDRATWRQHAAALMSGYRTKDAAFRLFQNEKLGRYTSLFNLAAQYAYLAAQAYDYETGLLGTSQGQTFLRQIISSAALGVVSDGVPQFTSTSEGDPGLANALAQMKGDWDVLKGRLGFNNPDGNGTTVSLRTENYRVLEGTNGDNAWQSVLQQGRVADVTADPDVSRLCLQIANGDGTPVPGIILTFSTTITDGMNLFGNPYSPGDHNFNPSSFATKIFAAGVCLDGYIGMDNPTLGGGVTPADPTTNSYGLGATPYVYLIPVGQDSMRSPPLGDASAIRSWNVDDVTVPLPYNVSASDFSSNPFYTSANSLSEPLFGIREHEAFRPVSSTALFSTAIYGADGALQPTEYTNRRLIGRSVWNSKWKLVIPGKNLLNDPNAGLDRFLASVKDIHLYFITYSYSGN